MNPGGYAMSTHQEPMSVREYWEQYAYKPYELIQGRVAPHQSLGFRHSVIVLRIESKLTEFANEHDLGEVIGAACPFLISRDTVRMPRAAFLSKKKWHSIKHPYNPFPLAPDLCVEVARTKGEQRHALEATRQYFAAGTQFVWIVYPQVGRIGVYHRAGKSRLLRAKDTIYGGKTLPGLELPVESLFPHSKEY